MQGIETSFLAREISHGKAPAFVELLKFKVGLLAWCTPSAATAQEQQLDVFHADLQRGCQGVGRSI